MSVLGLGKRIGLAELSKGKLISGTVRRAERKPDIGEGAALVLSAKSNVFQEVEKATVGVIVTDTKSRY